MRLTTTALLCATALAVAAPPADAAPKIKKRITLYSCRPPIEDGEDSLGQRVPALRIADIETGTLSTTGDQLVVQLRVGAGLSPADPVARLGTWAVGMAVRGQRVELALRFTATGAQVSSATVNGTAVTHTAEVRGDTITWRARGVAAFRGANRLDMGATTSVAGVDADQASGEAVRRKDGRWCGTGS